MEIARAVRDHAAKLADKERGMAEMSEKFRLLGGEVYVREVRWLWETVNHRKFWMLGGVASTFRTRLAGVSRCGSRP